MEAEQTYFGGDLVFYIPLEDDSQVIRNQEYFSVNLHSVYLYHRSAFFENIKTVVIQSDIKLDQQGKPAIGSMVNHVVEKEGDGKFIGLKDHLAVLTPATPSSVMYQVSFKGVGRDRFKDVFEVLSGSEFKIPLDLNETTLGMVGAVSSVIRKFTSSPYTVQNPKGMLYLRHSLILYPTASRNLDALREGFYVVISSREKKSADLSFLLRNRGKVRLKVDGPALYHKKNNGEWTLFDRNSYVIVAVTSHPRRGEDETSEWFRKFSSSLQAIDKLLTGKDESEVLDDAVDLWEQGCVLLSADSNYIQAEKDDIGSKKLDEIQQRLEEMKNRGWEAKTIGDIKVLFGDPKFPAGFKENAREYARLLEGHPPGSANLSVWVSDSKGNPVPGVMVNVKNAAGTFFKSMESGMDGMVMISNIQPGEYEIDAALAGFRLQKEGVDVKAYTINTAEIPIPVDR